jgi:elongation of very long chain fatty acids protein 6
MFDLISEYELKFQSRAFVNSLLKWSGDNWYLTIPYSILYIILIFSIKYYMKDRERYELKYLLVMWNIILSIFSITGAYKTIPHFINKLTNHGFIHTLCNDDFIYGSSGLWAYLFAVSKAFEFVDTLFVVFRKQKLIFLHYYHHTTVLIYCFYAYHEFSACTQWFLTMNYFIHSIMYTYYAFKALRLNIPSSISQLVTILQLVQMITGVYVNYQSYLLLDSVTSNCRLSRKNIYYSVLMYFSYFVLFANFFMHTYVFKTKKSSIKKFD